MNQDNRTPERLLLIGCKSFAGIDAVTWDEKCVPNLPDYDLVIVSTPHITEDFLREVDAQFFGDMRNALVRFLHSKGKLIILLSPVLRVKRPKKYPDWVTNLDWCPITFATPEEAGESIVRKWAMYEDYLQKMTDWSFYITIAKTYLSRELTSFYGSTHDTSYRLPHDPYLENRYGRILAGQYTIQVRKQRPESFRYGRISKSYPDEPDHCSGVIAVLPLIRGFTPEDALLDILKAEVGYSLKSPAPDWAQEISLPSVPELRENISLAQEAIKREQQAISEYAKGIERLNAFKRLLFGTGVELEDVVRKSFELFGATVEPAKYSQEEYILVVKGQEFLMEVKGVSKSISLGHLRQLNDYLLKYQEDTGKECKGILLGNAWRNMPPNMRNTDDTPEFPDNVVKRAEEWGIALISSLTLFNAVLRVLKDETVSPDILDSLIAASGIAEI